MKTRLSFLSILLTFLIFTVQAGEVKLNDAKKVALNSRYEKMHQYNNGVAYDEIRIINTYTRAEDGMAVYYAFDFADGGFVIVSAEDVYPPLIGYSFNGLFPRVNVPYAYESFMQSYADMIDYIRVNQLSAQPDVKSEWTRLLTNDISTLNTQKDGRDVEPLTSAMWDQDDPHNLYCPEKDGSKCMTGCVATAMSMIMYYYRYPLTGTGQHSYIPSPSIGTLSANFGETNYAWEGMRDNIEGSYPNPEALLQYHCGVSVNMNYCSNGVASGSYSYMVPNRLYNFWRYEDAQYHEKTNFTQTAWINLLVGQIDAGKPLYYSGSSTTGGHAFVCDGYQGTDFHFNFGWSGYGNGYFSLNNVGGYYIGQGCITEFYPSDPDYPYHAEGNIVITHMAGSFTDGSGPIEDYLNNQTATWLLDPQQSGNDSITNIDLEFTHFDLDAGDYLRVYDGATTSDPMLGEFTGSTLPSQLTSTGNKMLIALETNGSGTAPGFKAEFKADVYRWCNGLVELTEPTGTFTDGSGSFYYNNGATCMWRIQPPAAGNITLYFNSFDTEEEYDKMTVYDGSTKIAEFSGSSLPDPVTAASGSMFITWSTNGMVNMPGWEVYYEIDNVGIAEDEAFGNVYIYPNPANDVININFNSTLLQSFDIKLMNMTGQLLYTERIENQTGEFSKTIDISNFANGVYILSLSGNMGVVTEKIVIR